MDGPKFHDFNSSFRDYKKVQGIERDTGEILEGLWGAEQESDVAKFEQKYPGIRTAFDKLISLLPDADNREKDEFPFAASVVRISKDGKTEVLAMSPNRVNQLNDSTQHAELAVLQDAQKRTENKHLDDCILLSTAQPCEMCAGAIRNTHIDTVVYAVSQDDLRGTHVEFKEGFKPVRTTPASIDINNLLKESGVDVFAGYRRDDVLAKLRRTVGTFKELYIDPDSRL